MLIYLPNKFVQNRFKNQFNLVEKKSQFSLQKKKANWFSSGIDNDKKDKMMFID